MSHFIELTVCTEGMLCSRRSPERHTPTLVNVDHIRWVRGALNPVQSDIQIGEPGASDSHITVDEPYSDVMQRLSRF